MTRPKRRLVGTAYLVTGACERHEFRLKPSKETNGAFAYTLMEAAQRYGIDIVAVCQMSSHYHAIVYDRTGLLSAFLRDFHAVLARWGSARDHVENTKFWSGQGADAVELCDMESVVTATAYVLANPTKDFIVEQPESWVGVRTNVAEIGTGRGPVYQRPRRFFDPRGWTSDSVMLSSDYPHEMEGRMPLSRFRRSVEERIEKYVADATAEVKAGRRHWSGVERLKKLSVWHRALVPERRDKGRRAPPRSTVMAATSARLKAMLAAVLEFRQMHRAAWEAFRRGAYEAMFPSGSWFAWRFYGARRTQGLGAFEAPS